MRTIRIELLRGLLLAAALSVCVDAAPVDAGVVSGLVRTRTRPDMAPAAAVVYAEPLDSPASRGGAAFASTAGRQTAAPAALTQKHKMFQPQVLAVPMGATVAFPNQDPIFHNVFSLSGPQPFDLGLYRAGQARVRTFTEPGVYRVFCNIHPEMTALVLVVPTAYAAQADADGRFSLELPPGRYRLTAVSPRAPAISAEIVSTAGASEAPVLTLDESAWTPTPHKNKYGQDYSAASYRR
jgi:plastocyanin